MDLEERRSQEVDASRCLADPVRVAFIRFPPARNKIPGIATHANSQLAT